MTRLDTASDANRWLDRFVIHVRIRKLVFDRRVETGDNLTDEQLDTIFDQAAADAGMPLPAALAFACLSDSEVAELNNRALDLLGITPAGRRRFTNPDSGPLPEPHRPGKA